MLDFLSFSGVLAAYRLAFKRHLVVSLFIKMDDLEVRDSRHPLY